MSQFWNQNSRGRGRGRGRGGGSGGGFGGGGGSGNDGNRGNNNPLFSRLGAPSGQFGAQGDHNANRPSVGGFGGHPQGNNSVSFADSKMVGNTGGSAQVSIKGWRGGTEDSLKKFLDNKVGHPVNIMDIHYRGEIMYITVPNTNVAQELLNLSGIRFAGDKLSFQLKTHPVKFGTGGAGRDGVSNDSAKLKDRLIALLQTRADMQSNSLDLSALGQDNIIISLGTESQQEDKMFKAILAIASQIYPGLITISFANNGLRSLSGIADLGKNFPNIRNLSLMNNMLSDFGTLDCLSSRGSTVPLKHLEELILVGNPMTENELRQPNGGASYVEKVQQRFPTINMLDMNPVTPLAQPGTAPAANTIDVAAAKQLPFATEQSFVENQDIGELVNTFLAGFFGLYDSNRSALADIYDHTAQFSLVVDTTHPTSKFAQTSPDSQKHVDFSVYIRQSRNLTRVKYAQKRISTLVVGRTSIMQTLSQLPGTAHPIQDAQRFSYDAWQNDVPVTGGSSQTVAIVVVHGEFVEQGSNNLISFDRVFALAPSPPGSPAAAVGSPCIITNDQLTIRRYNGFESWVPSAGAGAVSADPAANYSLTPEQQEMARVLQEQTGLNAEWTLKCLESYGWNFQQAISEFPQARSTLPPDAFQ
ncbi:nuclear mRNA export, poly(A)+RNA binding protein [Coemansia erecta]|uniref:mRNA export factor MEX67 n=1 Tax=Coemansia erecta TaxID=147472 RepID=A0A9W8CSK2_9FUNG|nr:nuclear mRNA export, poly(A)+RNA binding protein [Coemansia erecta]